MAEDTRSKETILLKLADYLASSVADGNFDEFPFLRDAIVRDLRAVGVDLDEKVWLTTHWTVDLTEDMDPVTAPDPPGIIGIVRLRDDGLGY